MVIIFYVLTIFCVIYLVIYTFSKIYWIPTMLKIIFLKNAALYLWSFKALWH